MNFKKVLSCVLAMLMLVSMFSVTAFAEDDYVPADKLVSKTATAVGNGNYKVELKVPGETPDNTHDEVILMVDASNSGDKHWDAMKNAIVSIGAAVLNGSGNTQLTLMSYAMCGHTLLSHVKSMEELNAALNGSEPGCLLYGRSATNCEVGFTWVGDYIEAHDDTLKNAYVFYIGDGGANMSEEPLVYGDWQNRAWVGMSKVFSNENLAEYVFSVEVEEHEESGTNFSKSFLSIFGEDFDMDAFMAEANSAPEAALEKMMNLVEGIYQDVFDAAGLDRNTAYPLSVVERAFAAYDYANGTAIADAFYVAIYKKPYPEASSRATAAAQQLLTNDKIAKLYMVDTNAVNAWINNITSEKISVTQSSGVPGLVEATAALVEELAATRYNAVTVTDYMSKWVNLDQTTIAVVDDTTGQVIWNSTEGWLINSGRPTSKETPVEIAVVPVEEYPLGGAEVMGNTSGEIIKLTWYLKDANLLRSDSYHLEYIVSLDEAEEGYEVGCLYDANGATTVCYIDDEGNTYQEDIPVPVIGDPSADAVGKLGNVRIDTAEKMAVRFEDGSVYYDGDMKKMEFGVEYKFQLCAVNWETGTYDDNDNGLAGTVVYTAKLVDQDEFNRLREEALKNPERYTVKGIDIIDNDAKTIVINGDAVPVEEDDVPVHLETDVNNFFMAYRFHFTGEDYDKQTGIVGVVNTPVESLSVNLPLGATIACDAYISFEKVGSADILITNNSGEGIYENTELTSVNDYTWPY